MSSTLHSDILTRTNKIKEFVGGIHKWEENKQKKGSVDSTIAKEYPSNIELANKLKNEGNDYFKSGNFEKAIEKYTLAIEQNNGNHILYSNRAFAELKLKRFENVVKDCGRAILLDQSFAKAYFRRGIAHRELSNLDEALVDFERVLILEPRNNDANRELEATRQFIGKKMDIKKGTEDHGSKIPEAKLQKLDQLESTVFHGSERPPKENEAKIPEINEEMIERIRISREELKEIVNKDIRNSFEFLSIWKDVARDEEVVMQLLRRLKPASLAKFFGNNMTVEILEGYIKFIGTLAKENQLETAAEYIVGIMKIKRISILIRLMGETAKREVTEIVDEIVAKGISPDDGALRTLAKQIISK